MPRRSFRVAVCGSNYGRAYLSACAASAGRYRPAALLAHGSRRSVRLAAATGLPLCRSVDELPAALDLACVALPSAVTPEVASALLARGLPLLLEHPQRAPALETIYAEAERRRLVVEVNSHFGDLPAPAEFVERCHERARDERPRLIRITAQERALWAALEITGAALGALSPRALERNFASDGWVGLHGALGSTAAHLLVQSPAGDQADGSAAYLFDLRLEAAFSGGVLTLASLAGPVLWSANYSTGGGSAAALWSVSPTEAPSGIDLAARRTAANLAALDRLADAIQDGVRSPRHLPAATLEVAAAWGELATAVET